MTSRLLSKTIVVEEGLAKVYVPDLSEYVREDGVIEPSWMPVFYNPSAKFSRDVTVLVAKTYFSGREFFFLDLLSGTGVRGIRLSLEAGGVGILNDVDPRAYDYITENIKFNKLDDRLTAFNMEANALANLLTFTGVVIDYADVDPYGSPIPFLESVLKPLGKKALLGVTATDKGPLTCVNKEKTLKRYWLECHNVDFANELGIRVLTYVTALRASALNYAITPLLYLSKAHYYRVFYLVERRNPYEEISRCKGYIWYCPDTLERGLSKTGEPATSCRGGRRPIVIGPLWVCPLGSKEFVDRVVENLEKTPYLKNRDMLKYVNLLKSEVEVNVPYVRLDLLCKRVGVNMPNMDSLVERLRSMGFKASRTHLDYRGVKTDAPLDVLTSAIRETSRAGSS
jgi:tRNA (guanine26-N2/guanine27-N2)-dimethyltransferase